jgi:superfamily II DNA or RNA helicase/HKD family nuclease
MAVSFVMNSGLALLDVELGEAVRRPGLKLRLLTTDYLGITERAALEHLLIRMSSHPESMGVRLFRTSDVSFHPKAYLFRSSTQVDSGIGFVGSANISGGGLQRGVEWTLQTRHPGDIVEMRDRFEELWSDPRSVVLSEEVVRNYVEAPRAARGVVDAATVAEVAAEAEEAETPKPTEIQSEAITALEDTRAIGYGAGLVVLATGLGKTWLAAFDSARPWARRILFLAHRDELLTQAISVFHRAQPLRRTGWLRGDADVTGADVVFANVSTMTNRLESFDPVAFDYIVVDEFHHAVAKTYRRILGRFDPQFMLGLTATPDRTDGADLLALCEDNLVYEAALSQGIERGGLVPFDYIGVPDTIDFEPIPWRNGKFDPTALENAAITIERANRALHEWQLHGGDRTIAFCVSVRHAEFMAQHFSQRGISTAAVHASEGSAPRHETLDALARGDVQVVFAVDLFNEGVDVPMIDTVLMLRPTASPVLFLQQLGRGLRTAEGKDRLSVVDFVGNHRSFLMKPRILLGLAGSRVTDAQLRKALERGEFELPVGCSVEYKLEALDILSLLLGHRGVGSALVQYLKEQTVETGKRPTAVQTFRAGLNVGVAKKDGGWFSLLDQLGLLTPEEQEVLLAHGDLLRQVAIEPMTKSYKMVLLRAMTMGFALGPGMPLERLAAVSQRLIARDPRLLADATSVSMSDPAGANRTTWAGYWRKWPVAAWLGELKGTPSGFFRLDDGRFTLVRTVQEEAVSTLNQMVAEIVDWRLAWYLDVKAPSSAEGALLKVLTNGRAPILFLDRERNPDLPLGKDIPVFVDGQLLHADFVKIAVNVVRDTPQGPNVLPDLLWRWFGPEAGQAGTAHRVLLKVTDTGDWLLTPHRAGEDPPQASAALVL